MTILQTVALPLGFVDGIGLKKKAREQFPSFLLRGCSWLDIIGEHPTCNLCRATLR